MVKAGGPPEPRVEHSGDGRSAAAPGKGEAWLGQVIEAIPSALIVVSPDDAILTLNRAAERIFGYSRAELAGRPAASLLAHGAWSAQPTPGSKLRGLRKDGSEFPIEITARPIAVGAGLVLCTILDLSPDRQQEASRSEALFSAVFRASPNMITVTTMAEGRYVDVNESFLRIWGRQRSEVIGRTSQEIGFWNDESLRSRMLADLRRDGFIRGLEARIRTSSGALRDFIYSIDLIPHQDEALLLGIGHDVTELRAAEAQLRHAQRLEAIGKLTGGVAHDFNNLLAIMQGNLELLDESISEASPLKPLVQDALRAAGRGASLTDQLLAYSRQQPLSPDIIDIGDLLLEMSGLLERTLGATIAIRSDIAADLWPARIDPNQLANAILNIAVNARDAMPDGGKLTIEASNTTLDQDYADRNTEVAPGPYVLVALTDTGSGMSPAVLERALEPFFTTKEVGQGSGLGLSMVYGFAKQSSGHLKIYSEPGRGTTVRLYLPKAEGDCKAPVRPAEPHSLQASRAGETVLIVEDDAMVRALAIRILAGLGYRTLEASDGATAAAVLDAAGPVDLLLTDVVLPRGISGPQLARQAQARFPNLQVLYMSGYTRNAIIHNGVLDQGVHLLTKPFLKHELALAVRSRLDGRKA
jgi:PAS domain S-box-containing protein